MSEVCKESVATRHRNMVAELSKQGDAILATLTPTKMHLLHMAVGVMGEVVELFASTDWANTIEELGDIEFYFVGMLQGIELSYEELSYVDVIEYFYDADVTALDALLVESGRLLDLTKKLCIYNKDTSADLMSALANIKMLMNCLYEELETGREAVLAANLWKLREGPNARYKTGYSDQAAQKRADKPTGQ